VDKYPLPSMAFPDGKVELFDITVNQVWAQMEELLETGKVRAIGVSNFSIKT
jgi:glycerol 2-dehydrogenase (NADP+)